MSAESVSETERPRLTVAVSKRSGLSDKIAGLMSDVGVAVDRIEIDDDIRKIAAGNGGRAILIDRTQLPEDPTDYLKEIICDTESPALVVITDHDDALDRTQILAAGASHVVNARDSDSSVHRTLSAIAEGESEGGPHGPDIRGHHAQPRLSDFVSRSQSMRRFLKIVDRVAHVDCSLLITGETGVGKERLARTIHQVQDKTMPFLSVNCGAIPEALIESQLFGHEKGAFTGANTSQRGFFEQAHGGIIFLDEVSEIPLHLQVKLLSVLQSREVRRLGSEKVIPVDVRVIAATNRDLRAEMEAGRFREDLYFRLNVVHLQIPPLRKRREDIPDLVGSLIRFFRCDLAKTSIENISEAALTCLQAYSWPGNIRELINVIERAMILGDGPLIEPQDLPADVEFNLGPTAFAATEHANGLNDSNGTNGNGTKSVDAEKSLREIREDAGAAAESEYLERLLIAMKGDLKAVAAKAQISLRALYEKMQRHGKRREDYLGD